MIRQFVKDTGMYGISGFITKGVSFILVPFYTRVLTPADYGMMDIISVVYAIVAIAVPLEITQAVARFLADKQNEEDLTKDENTILVSSVGLYFTLISFTIFLIVGLLINKWLAKVLFEDVNKNSIMIAALFNMYFTGLFYFVQNQLRWTLKAKKMAMLTIIYTIINISLTVVFVLFLATGVIGVFYAFIISGFICFLLGLYFSRENYAMIYSFSKLKEMLKFSLPLVPSSVGTFFINYSQRVMIKSLMSLTDLGLFGVGSRISSVINLGFQSVQGAILPLIYQNFHKKETPEQLANIFRYIVFILSIVFIVLSIFAREIIVILTTPSYYNSFLLIPFLLLSESFFGLQRSFSPGLFLKKRTDILAYINIGSAIFTLAISFLMIYLFGLLGAAIAVLIQSVSIFIVQLSFSQKFYFIPYKYKTIIFTSLTSVLFVVIAWNLTFIENLFIVLSLKILLIFGFIIISITFIKIISKEELKVMYYKLFKSK